MNLGANDIAGVDLVRVCENSQKRAMPIKILGKKKSLPKKVYSKKTSSGVRYVLSDMIRSLALIDVWRVFAIEQILVRYRRSILGLLWIPLSYLLVLFAILIFFGELSTLDGRAFAIYIAFGYLIYQFCISTMTSAPVVFVGASNWITSVNLPYTVHAIIMLLRNLFGFVINLTAALIVVFAFGWRPETTALWALPGLFILLLNAVWVLIFLGIVGAKIRDLQHFLNSISIFFFFSSPIMWAPQDQSGFVLKISIVNPVTHFIELIRAPLLGEMPSQLNVAYVAVFTLAGWVTALCAASIYYRRLSLWVR